MEEATIEYRLDNIEKVLSELKDVVLENKMQARDIRDLTSTQKEILQAINAHEKRIKELEMKPVQERADKWQYILDYIFKGLVAAAIGYVFIKMGLN